MNLRFCHFLVVSAAGLLLLEPLAVRSLAQELPQQQAQETSPIVGIDSAQVGQVFDLPPNPGAPFTAVVEFETTQTLTDGTIVTRKSSSGVARDSKGRTRNELRAQSGAQAGVQGEILQIVLYDPGTRLRTTISPRTHTARRSAVAALSDSTVRTGTKGTSQKSRQTESSPGRHASQAEEVGIDYMGAFEVKHFRERRTFAAGTAGNDRDIQTMYEYWYSPDLKVNLLSKRVDPRTGTQTATLKEIHRGEPDAALFEIPAGYKMMGPDKTGQVAH
jgi:hypothetical protein